MMQFEVVNLIRLFDFYLATVFVIGMYRRWRVYSDAIRLGLFTMNRRRLLGRVSEHKAVLLTGEVLRPVILTLSLMIMQFLCSRVIFPHAQITLAQVFTDLWQTMILSLMFVPMLAVDVYFLIRVGRFDRGETEKYLHQAESWLGWRASAVRIATMGIVDPRKIVDKEVRKGMKELGATVSWSLYWVSVQIALRVAFGATIWILWVVHM